jgi:putative transposase
VSCRQQALRGLDRAFQNFLAGRASFLRPRGRGVDHSFRFLGPAVTVRRPNANWSAVRLPTIGWVKARGSRPIRGVVMKVTVSRDPLGWHVAFTCEIAHGAPAPSSGAVGIDRGVPTTLALSSGEMLAMSANLERVEAGKRTAQRAVARCKRGLNRRRRAQGRAARMQARIRHDFHQRAALAIATCPCVAVLEHLNTRGMTAGARNTMSEPSPNVRQKAGLNRVVLAAGWHLFATILTYKMEERGGQVVTVPARLTSQTWAACGVGDARGSESQARFVRIGCGYKDHAAVNVAINIERRWSTPLLRMDGLHRQPCKVRTGRDSGISGNPRRSRRGRR